MNTGPALYGLPNCDSVRRARAWLQAQGVAHDFHDFRKSGLPPARLDAWIAAAGWERLVNRQGLTWRKLDPAIRERVIDAASARALMLASPSLVKRPVAEWPGGEISVGFEAEHYAALLAGQAGRVGRPA